MPSKPVYILEFWRCKNKKNSNKNQNNTQKISTINHTTKPIEQSLDRRTGSLNYQKKEADPATRVSLFTKRKRRRLSAVDHHFSAIDDLVLIADFINIKSCSQTIHLKLHFTICSQRLAGYFSARNIVDRDLKWLTLQLGDARHQEVYIIRGWIRQCLYAKLAGNGCTAVAVAITHAGSR